MPSIRRSLIAYFLLLLGLALLGVGVLVDQFAQRFGHSRETAEAARIEQEFAYRSAETEQQFNDALEQRALNLGRELRWKYAFLTSPDRQREAEDQLKFKQTMAVLPASLGAASPWAGVVTVPLSREQVALSFRNWSQRYWLFWTFQRAVTDEQIRRSFAEGDDHPRLFQFEFPRLRMVIRGPQGPELPPADPTGSRAASPSWHEDVTVGGTVVRRVVVRYPLFGGPFRGGPPRHSMMMAMTGGAGWPLFWMVSDPNVDSFPLIHVGRPKAELDAELARHAAQRDEALAEAARETRGAMADLRVSLVLIAGLAFLALALGGWFLVGRGLGPLRKLSDAVSRVTEKDFRLPVTADELSHELVPIHDRLTHTLGALHRAFDREKQAVADISHELRTPLAALLTTLDVTLRKPRDADHYKGKLEECRDIGRQLGRLVERIMTLAWLDAGTDTTRSEPIDVADLAGGCAAVIRPLAEAHGLTFHATIDPTAQVVTDPDKLREALMCLMHNAVEYNRPDGRVELRAERTNGDVTFEVRDTGIGMTPDVQDKIFERFYRADPSRTATGVHAGLGLAIVKEYVDRLGGTIAVESAPGVGSTFRVTVPAADGIDSDGAELATSGAATSPAR